MKKTTRILAVLLATFSLLALTACGKGGSSSSVSAVQSSSSEAQASSSVPSSVAPSSVSSAPAESAPKAAPGEGLGNNLDIFQISLDGTVFTFPGSTFADFIADGWVIDPGAAGASLPANTATSIDFTKNGATIRLQALNTTTGAVPVEEATCAGVTIDKYKIGQVQVAMPANLTIGSSSEDVLAAYGEPREKYNSKQTNEILTLTYGSGAKDVYELSFFENGVSGIRIYTKSNA